MADKTRRLCRCYISLALP